MKNLVSLKVPRGDAELIRIADLAADGICQSGHPPLVASCEIADQALPLGVLIRSSNTRI